MRRGRELGKEDRKTVCRVTCSTRLNVRLFIGFCVVQRPRQSHQYIREGEGKRVSSTICKVFSRATGRKAFSAGWQIRETRATIWKPIESSGRLEQRKLRTVETGFLFKHRITVAWSMLKFKCRFTRSINNLAVFRATFSPVWLRLLKANNVTSMYCATLMTLIAYATM